MQQKNVRWTPEQITRRKARNQKIVFGFFLILGIIVVLESPLTRVRTFEISGNRTIPAAKIMQDTTLHVGMNSWQVRGGTVSQQIMDKEPLVQSVAVKTDFIRGVVSLQITEKHIVSIYEASGKFYNLLNDGTAYQEVSANSGFSFAIVTTEKSEPVKLGQVVNPDVQLVCRQLSQISDLSLSTVSEIHIVGQGDAIVYLDNGFVVTCSQTQLGVALPDAREAVAYFSSKGYQPGMIDLTGPPPYRYMPFARKPVNQTSIKGG